MRWQGTHVASANDVKIIARFKGGIISGPDLIEQSVMVDGRTWHFDFDWYCGPLWTRKNGQPLSNQNPPKAVWEAFNVWLEKQKRPKL